MTTHARPRPAAGDFSSTLAKARRGDSAAVAALYSAYGNRIVAAVRTRLPPPLRRKYDTMDFVHSVFAEVIRDLPRIEDRGEGAFVRLLMVKAVAKVHLKLRRHLGRDGRREEMRLATGSGKPSSRPGVDEALGSIEEDVKLHRLLGSLDARSREIIRMRGQEKSFAEIAGALGMQSAEAARKRHARVLVELRRQWERAGN